MKKVIPVIVEGDLLDQPVGIIVNAWNRNIIPWLLLLPQGVSRDSQERPNPSWWCCSDRSLQTELSRHNSCGWH
jgi:hypothetical protein